MLLYQFNFISMSCSPENPGLSCHILRMGLEPLIPLYREGFGFLGFMIKYDIRISIKTSLYHVQCCISRFIANKPQTSKQNEINH